jgi:hypothetical protein
MIPELVIATVLMSQPQQNDPFEAALAYQQHLTEYIEETERIETAIDERTLDAQVVSRTNRNATGATSLPSLLLTIRSEESGGGVPGAYNYSAYNASGCEGWGCGGAYQLHAQYASGWAANAGYSGLGSNAAVWPAPVQDAVALNLFYSTNPDGAHWCNWTDYC